MSGPRLTVAHRFDFGADRRLVGDDLVRPEAWDALRSETSGSFGLAADRAELEADAAARPEITDRMHAVSRTLDELGARRVASYGAGTGLVEYALWRADPSRSIVLTEYAPVTAARLHELLPELTVVRHDLLADDPLKADVHLFHRIDTELGDDQWRGLYTRFSDETIVVVATEVATLGRIATEVLSRPLRRRASHAGWLRTRAAFEALWAPTHRAEPRRFADLDGWVLRPRVS